MTTVDQLIEKYKPHLEEIAVCAFQRDLVHACFSNLAVPGPLRFNNFAYAFRELLRHVFHRRAPDTSLKQCSWYKPDPTAGNGVTRNHRAKYMIQGGLSDFFVKENLEIDVRPVLSRLTKALNVLNSFTHVEINTFGLTESKVEELTEQCLEAGKSLLDIIDECRLSILDRLSSQIDDHLISETISGTIVHLDELATHNRVDWVEVNELAVLDIGSSMLKVQAKGNIEVELQWGSNSDVRKDIGARKNESFPFSAEVHVKLQQPLGKHAAVKNFEPDTRSWYD